MANHLKRDRQVQIVQMAVEGCSIRSIERMTGSHRDSIMHHLVRVGQHCQELHDEHVRNVRCQYVQCDEIWAYVGKKQRRVMPSESSDFGDAYTFVGIDQDSKLVLSYMIGKRDEGHTYEFMGDLSRRISGHIQVSTDGWGCYPSAVMDSFNGRSSYGQIVKSFGGGPTDTAHRYSPPGLSGARRIGM